jgi:hypothetical protein
MFPYKHRAFSPPSHFPNFQKMLLGGLNRSRNRKQRIYRVCTRKNIITDEMAHIFYVLQLMLYMHPIVSQ